MSVHLTYFPVYAKAELIRWLLHYNGVEYTERTVTFPEWAELKASGYPEFGSLPMLEVDGYKLSQSLAIARYLAIKFDMVPADSRAKWEVDSIMDACGDIISARGRTYWMESAENFTELTTVKMFDTLSIFQARLDSHNNGEGFLTGDRVTVGDLALARVIYDAYMTGEYVEKYGPVLDEKLPRLKDYALRVINTSESLQKYLSERPFYPV